MPTQPTDVIGVGLMPAGTGPAGLAVPATTPAPDRTLVQSRYYNPLTKDFEFGETGNFSAMPTIRQKVILALMNTKGTMLSNQSFGNSIPSIQKIDDAIENKVITAVRSALDHLRNEIIIEGVDVEIKETGRIAYTVRYREKGGEALADFIEV